MGDDGGGGYIGSAVERGAAPPRTHAAHLLPELADARRAVALGQLALVRRQDEAHVAKQGRREAQRLVDEHLGEGGGGR